jgi:hypothetical protein
MNLSFQRWLQNLRFALSPGRGRRRHGRSAGSGIRGATYRPHVESLEDRRLLAFLAPVDYAVGLEPLEVATGDFNNDGQPDLATTNNGDNTVSVLLGNADGTFQPPLTFTAGPFPLALAVGHFNADDNLDLAVTTYDPYGDNDVSILLGNGAGEFVSAASLSIPWWFVPVSVSTGDMNADGITDLVLVADDVEYGHGGSVNVILGQGNGNFEPAVAYGAYYGQYSSRALVLADFNNDGNTDVVVAGSLRTVKVLMGNGDGTLGTARDFGADYAARSIAVGDFNADGKLDLAVTDGHDYGSPGVSDINILLGTGTGSFQTAQSFAAGTMPDGLRAGDVNGDGVLDLVVTNAESLGILMGTGGGSFGAPITVAGSHGVYVLLTDFNGDRRLDVAVTNTDSNSVSVLINDGGGTPPPSTPPLPSVSVGDVTGSEGNFATKAASFIVTLSAASSQPVTVAYATANGTAAAGSDYQAAFGTLTIPAGQTSGTIIVLMNGDRVAEANETFIVNLSSPAGATIADGQGVGTVVDDEPRVSISDVTKKEGKKGQTTLFTFTVTISAAYDQPVTMSFRTVDGTAKTGDNDYVAKTGTLTFAPGETTKTITIKVKGDSKRESNEMFYLDLFGNSSNSLFTKNRGIGTILNDD